MLARPGRAAAFALGEVVIDRVVEMLGPVRDAASMFPRWTEAAWTAELPWMAPDFVDPESGRYISSIQSWLLRWANGPTVLIDACAGNGRERRHAPRYHRLRSDYVGDLATLGVDADHVDFVVLTHLHEDHVGWCTHRIGGDWVPMFPRARHLVSRIELDGFMARANLRPARDDASLIFEDTIAPLLTAGLLETFDPPYAPFSALSLEAAPGHTAGQCVARLVTDRHEVLFTADVMHHPIQIVRPDWSTRFCERPEVAAATRHAILAEAAARDLILAPAHFGQRQLTRIVRDGDAFRPVFFGADDLVAAS